jgi:hypothetical protein
MLEPDYKAGLGGVREYDNITWLSRFIYPWGSQGLVGLLGGWAAMALERRVSLKQLLLARRAYLRQARLRDREIPYALLTREEKIQYVRDAGVLFDTLVSLLQSYWIQPRRSSEARRGDDPEYVPLFLASAGWRPAPGHPNESVTAWRGQKIVVLVRRPKVENMAEITIEAVSDRPGVLAILSGLLAAQGLSIQAAEAAYEWGTVTDRFFVTMPALNVQETTRYAQERIEDLGRRIGERAETLFKNGVNIAAVAEDFKKKGLDYRFVLPEGAEAGQSLVFFHEGNGKRTLTLMTRDRAVGRGKDLKNGTGTLHVISRWFAENGYTIQGNPSVRTQEGVVLNSFRLRRVDGRAMGWIEERTVETALEEFLDRPVIEEKDFGSGLILPGAAPLSGVLAPWQNFPTLRIALNPLGRAVLFGFGALLLLVAPDAAWAAQTVADGAASFETWTAGLGMAAAVVGRPRGGVNTDKVEALFRSGGWGEIQAYLKEMKSVAGRDPAAYVDGACILLLRLLSLTTNLPEAERAPAQTELREKMWGLVGSLTSDAVAGPGADVFTRHYIAAVMLDNLASRALDTGDFELTEALLAKSAEHQEFAAAAAGDAPASAKAFPRPVKAAEARTAIAHTRARLAFRKGDFPATRAIATEALSDPAGAFNHPIQSARDLGFDLEFYVAEAHAAEGNVDEAVRAFQRAQNRVPEDPRALTGEAVLWLEQAARATESGEKAVRARHALSLLDQAAAKGDLTVRHLRTRLSAHLLLHELAPAEGHLAAAEALLPKAIALHPDEADIARVWLNRWFGADDFAQGFARLTAARDAVLNDKKTQKPERVDFQFLSSLNAALGQLEAKGFDVAGALTAVSVDARDASASAAAADAAFQLHLRGDTAAFGRSLDALRAFMTTAAEAALAKKTGAQETVVFKKALENLQRVSDVDWVVRTLVPRAAASENRTAQNALVDFLKDNAEDVSVGALHALRNDAAVMAVRPFANFANLNWKRAQEQFPKQIGQLADAPIADWVFAEALLADARLLGVEDKPGVQKLRALWDVREAERVALEAEGAALAAKQKQQSLAAARPENLKAMRDLRQRLGERRNRIISSQNPAMALDHWEKSQELFVQAEGLLARVDGDPDAEIRRVADDLRTMVRGVKNFYAIQAKGPWRDAVTDQLAWEGNAILDDWRNAPLSGSVIKRLTRESLEWIRLARALLVRNTEDGEIVREESRKLLEQARIYRPRKERGAAAIEILAAITGLLAVAVLAVPVDRVWIALGAGLAVAGAAARSARRWSRRGPPIAPAEKPALPAGPVVLDRRTDLDRSLLGGPAGPVTVGHLTADIARVRLYVEEERGRARAARETLAAEFGNRSLTDGKGGLYRSAVRRLGASVAAATRREDPAAAADRVFLGLATLGEYNLNADQWKLWAAEFAAGFNTGISAAGEKILAALDARRPLVVEITESMLGESPDPRDQTRLVELKVLLALKSNLRPGQLTWVLPRGVEDLDRLPRDLAGLRDIRAGVRVKSQIPLTDGKRSVKALLLDLQGRSRVADLAATDLFLMDRGDWVVESDLPKDVARLLIALAGGLVVDATNLLANEIKNLLYLQTNA